MASTIDRVVTLPLLTAPVSEIDVELSGIKDYVERLGYVVKSRKTGLAELDAAWPSKTVKKTGSGQPDFFLFAADSNGMPLCVWENKGTDVSVETALGEAKAYVDGAHTLLPSKANLPRIAVGYNGLALAVEYKSPDNKWIPLRSEGTEIIDDFPAAEALSRGVRGDGNIVGPAADLDARTLRSVFEKLKVIYRGVPALKSGRRPIDFTVAVLTLRLLVERRQWGSWSEQPSLATDAATLDQQVSERFKTLVSRCLADTELKESYGSIFHFSEQSENEGEIAFDFLKVLSGIPTGKDIFKRIFELIDTLPVLHGADIDIFGEVYQAIGDENVKKAFGEYFTGRHIIAGVVPAFFARAGADSFDAGFENRSFADIACGTGGFLTETLRYVKRTFALPEDELSEFAGQSFFGYDLSASNASRARVNMYFAGDGYSVIEGDVDSLDEKSSKGPRKRKFDYVLTNPPYGSSSEHHLLHERFLARVVNVLKPATGWGLVVMPTGSLQNPRSADARLELLKSAQVTDVISLPKHAFAPYTMQKTAILILKRRATPIKAAGWAQLVSQVGHEKISMFIVDNDGFANSDKRFPTRRRKASGQWEHDDLSAWLDLDGQLQDSNLFSALIKEKFVNSVGEPAKYGRFSLNDLKDQMDLWGADRGSGIELLPDSFLRSGTVTLDSEEFFARTDGLLEKLSTFDLAAGGGLLRELNELLNSPVELPEDERVETTISKLFHVKKGNPSLTEAAMYEWFDENGLPVYGGGVSAPTQRISRNAETAAGKKVTIFSGPAIVLSVDGSSGAMQIVESGDFASNHHAAVLTPKDPAANLALIAHQSEGLLKALASNKEGSATLTVGTITSFGVALPTDETLGKRIGEARKALSDLRSLLL